jgi:predicted DNA-binding transcriptional regulator YafY
MRADRLVAILLLLQRRGRVTAAEAAAELEISERTARRDLEALGMAGLPVYSTRGRNGGWGLAGGGRTDLSGLNETEVRTLFLLAGPSSAATPELRAALRKLVRALPEPFRKTAEAASQAVVVDRSGWDGSRRDRPDPPHLDAVQRAVVEGRQAAIGYVAADGSATTRTVHPLGLAVKGSVWYLVAGTERGERTFRVDRMRSVEISEVPAVRPAGFDLADAWRSIAAGVDELRTPARARAVVSSDSLSLLRYVFGKRMIIGPPQSDGRVQVELRSSGDRALAGEIAGFGTLIEVVEPRAICEILAGIGAELVDLYGGSPGRG